jgi:hypothetical protein
VISWTIDIKPINPFNIKNKLSPAIVVDFLGFVISVLIIFIVLRPVLSVLVISIQVISPIPEQLTR